MEKKTIVVSGNALVMLEDFIKYAELYPDEMASVMWYNIDGFKQSVKELKNSYEKSPYERV